MSKEVTAKEQEMERVRLDYQGKLTRMELDLQEYIEKARAEIQAVMQEGNEIIFRLQQEGDALALAEKLKQFPAELVANHKTCSVCGAEMRPFSVAENGGKITKAWACQDGHLQPNHDLVFIA